MEHIWIIRYSDGTMRCCVGSEEAVEEIALQYAEGREYIIIE